MKPFFGYFGGKFNASRYYPPPSNRVIVEPFAGSAGYSIRHPHHSIILADKDPVIYGIWKYLISVKASEIRRVPVNLRHVDEIKGPQELKWFIGFWFTKAASHPNNAPSAWMRSGEHATSFWGESIRHRIASQVEHIRHWQVLNCSFDEIPEIYATWFIDPPYEKQGHRYRHNVINYPHLASWCRYQRDQIIVCEQEGATWLPFKHFREIRGIKYYSNEVWYYREHKQ